MHALLDGRKQQEAGIVSQYSNILLEGFKSLENFDFILVLLKEAYTKNTGKDYDTGSVVYESMLGYAGNTLFSMWSSNWDPSIEERIREAIENIALILYPGDRNLRTMVDYRCGLDIDGAKPLLIFAQVVVLLERSKSKNYRDAGPLSYQSLNHFILISLLKKFMSDGNEENDANLSADITNHGISLTEKLIADIPEQYFTFKPNEEEIISRRMVADLD